MFCVLGLQISKIWFLYIKFDKVRGTYEQMITIEYDISMFYQIPSLSKYILVSMVRKIRNMESIYKESMK